MLLLAPYNWSFKQKTSKGGRNMVEPVAKLTGKNIETVASTDTAQLEVPLKAILICKCFLPKGITKGMRDDGGH
jgi:hypothetical protein